MIGKLVLLLALLASCQPEGAPGRREIRAALQVPHFRPPLAPQLVQTWKQRDLIFEQVRFQGRDGEWLDAVVGYSELGNFRPLPALLCMPGSGNRKEDLLRPLDLLPRWAERGFFVLSIDRAQEEEEARVQQKGLAGLWGEHIYDLMRALDYLESRPQVDRERVGMLGLSLGGMEALWLGALDPRLKAVVSVAGHLAWEEVFGGNAWRLIFGRLGLGQALIKEGASGARAWEAFRDACPQLEALDAARIAPQLAPRPLLLMTGEEDPYIPPAATRRVFAAALVAYAAAGRPECLEMWVEPQIGHGFSAPMQERALAWFIRWL